MKLERVVTETPPADRMRQMDTLVFRHQLFEDVKTGHIYIRNVDDRRGWVRLTND